MPSADTQYRFRPDRKAGPLAQRPMEAPNTAVLSRPVPQRPGRTRRHHYLPVQHACFAIRLANDRDQARLPFPAVFGCVAQSLSVPCRRLEPREVLAFGEGVALADPAWRLQEVPPHHLPNAVRRPIATVPSVAPVHDMQFRLRRAWSAGRGPHSHRDVAETHPTITSRPLRATMPLERPIAGQPSSGTDPDRLSPSLRSRCARP